MASLGDSPLGNRSRAGPLKVALGPALAGLVLLLAPGDEPGIARMAAIAAWMATWWITEAIPIAATSLLPLVLIPFAGISPVADVAANYGRWVIFLFLGGFFLALGLQHSGAHRRMALTIVAAVGSNPRRIVLGFMLASWLLSMWIANTSTAMLMLPIALSVLQTAADRHDGDISALGNFPVVLMLSIAYACNMGGMSTLVGTPPNLAFLRLFHQFFPDAPEITFLKWMMLALPFTATFLVLGWLLLTRVLFKLPTGSILGGHDTVLQLKRELGPRRRDETVAATVFAATALLWVTGASFTFGDTHLPGWRELLGVQDTVNDAVVAVGMALLLFLIPSQDRPGERLLEWRFSNEVPWGLLLLFGGGFALASGFSASGLSQWAGGHFIALQDVSPLLLVVFVCAGLTLLTELTSNIATTEMVLPILAAAAVAVEVDPRALMIPATLSASCAFMMPVATPPAAIVFGSGLVPIRQMIRTGIWFNLLGLILVVGVCWLLGGPVLGLDLESMPPWARP